MHVDIRETGRGHWTVHPAGGHPGWYVGDGSGEAVRCQQASAVQAPERRGGAVAGDGASAGGDVRHGAGAAPQSPSYFRTRSPSRRRSRRAGRRLRAEFPHHHSRADREMGSDEHPRARPSPSSAARSHPLDGTRVAPRGLPRIRQRSASRLGRPGRSRGGDAVGASRPIGLGIRRRPAPT